MLLRELFYFDKETIEPIEDDSYESEYDTSPVEYDDTRKSRLTLSQINRIRKASEVHTKEKQKELDFIRQMYGLSATAAATGV